MTEPQTPKEQIEALIRSCIDDPNDRTIAEVVAQLEQMIKDAEFKARMDEHKILMANIGGEYSSAIHGLLPKTKLDTGKIGEALKQRLTELEGRK